MKKNKKSHKLIAIVLTLSFLPSLMPINMLYASNNGPNAPEVAGFEPVDATDMVNLNTGNLAYTLPLMDVDGFPISMAYHAGVPAMLDASWVGLGWYLNTGAINRQQVAVPDDWKGGSSINFISYENAETTYELGVGVAAPGMAYAGIGISWGSNQALTGMVEAGVGLAAMFADESGVGLSGSITTSGQYYIGAYAGVQIKESPVNVGASLGYSSGGWIAGIGASLSDGNSKTGMSSLGIGYNSKGMFSIGAGGGRQISDGKGGFGGAGLSMGSFSSGDYDISVKNLGARIPLFFIPAYIRFGRRKVTYDLRKGYKDTAYGALYTAEALDTFPVNDPDANFSDYQDRYTYMDVYEQELPQQEEEFITDYSADRERLNFTFSGYDIFDVQANGIGGSLRPRLLDNVTLFNRGFDGTDTEVSNRKKHVFYHHSGWDSNRYFGSNNRQMHMYFDGTFSAREEVIPSTVTLGGNKLGDMVDDPMENGSFLSNPNARATTPSYVEVFTNAELANQTFVGQYGIAEPEALSFSVRNNQNYVDPDGIGAYRITSPDGKTYHFALPVYQFEQVKRTLLKSANQPAHDAWDVTESRQYDRYATHWLLTAVTGPDYVDTNNDGKVGIEDYGYWVRLDHGKWSDGYTWRQPYEDDARNYTTNIKKEIDEDDFGYFSFGRKQLYYLNKIVSREHTAFFVKDIRSDAVGKSLTFKFDNQNNGGNASIGVTGNPGTLNQSMGSVEVREAGVNYQTEYTLGLEKIILVRNENAAVLTPNLGSGLGYDLGAMFEGYQKNEAVSINWQSSDFSSHYGNGYTYTLHQEDNILDVQDLMVSGIQNHILKEVRLNHSYDLAKNSPNSNITPVNPDKGKLTLESLEFRGRQGAKYMPPYRFDYYDREKENISLEKLRQDVITAYGPDNESGYREKYYLERKALIDDWGYVHDDEDRWSLKSIKMPTGASMNIDYEEDDYWIEAFSRRYWENDLEFNLENFQSLTPSRAILTVGVAKDRNSTVDDFPFTDYFSVLDSCGIDFYIARCRNKRLSGNNDISEMESSEGRAEVLYVDPNYMRLEFECYVAQYETDLVSRTSAQDPISKTNQPLDDRLEISGVKEVRCGGGGTSTWNLVYRVLANQIPENETGGGLKVTRVTTTTDSGSVGVLEYDYSFPQGHEKAGRSSGITSFAPIDGLQFVPYQTELPSPGVQYEYVTIFRKDGSNNVLDYTQYNFHTLKPVFDIFSENLTLENQDRDATEDPIFWTEVTTEKLGVYEAKNIEVHLNSGILGQYKGIKQYNAPGHLLSSVDYGYTNGTQLTDQGQGYVQESFNSLKSVFRTDRDGNGPSLLKRLLSVSTRSEYNNALRSVSNTANGHTSTVSYTEVDPILGSYRNSETVGADGVLTRQRRIPAYEVYPGMGPKAENPNNTNMLTQEAMMMTDVDVGGQWRTTQASANTWHNAARYEAAATLTNDGIWRKLGQWAWRAVPDAQGTYGLEIAPTDFQWGYGQAQSRSEWLNIGETTRYNHYSVPLEAVDINDNYVASKTGPNGYRVLATSNASYGEMFYTGAEEFIGMDLGGGVTLGTGSISTGKKHTGIHSILVGPGQHTFQVQLIPQKSTQFKASLWLLGNDTSGLALDVGGAIIPFSTAEVNTAGQWTQLNFYFDATSETSIKVVNQGTLQLRVDDIRIHPITAAMSSYIYNDKGELSHVLGANNLGVEYRYDEAGRLSELRSEAIDFSGQGSGGFKKTQTYNYTYKYTAQ